MPNLLQRLRSRRTYLLVPEDARHPDVQVPRSLLPVANLHSHTFVEAKSAGVGVEGASSSRPTNRRQLLTKPHTDATASRIFHTLLVFRAPTTLSEALATLAASQGTSVSAVIRRFLEAGLRNQPLADSSANEKPA